MTHEGRQLLYRIGLWCSREWGHALARQMQQEPKVPGKTYADPPNLDAPFEIHAWHDALELVDDLRSGRPVKEKFRCE
jgi:hypothetical protein